MAKKDTKKTKDVAANEEPVHNWEPFCHDAISRTEVIPLREGVLIRTIYFGATEGTQPAVAMCFIPVKGKKK